MYTEPSGVATLDPQELAAELRQTVENGFHVVPDPAAVASRPLSAGKWSAKQVVWHLIDSAGNNLQRCVRLQAELVLEFPGHRQERGFRCSVTT